jgi:hypothetical protein
VTLGALVALGVIVFIARRRERALEKAEADVMLPELEKSDLFSNPLHFISDLITAAARFISDRSIVDKIWVRGNDRVRNAVLQISA